MSERTFLEEITIRSIGVIDSATLEISPGLTVLTGETGAGKTMILTALNLILGGKSDYTLVRKDTERLLASGRFVIPKNQISVFEDSGVVIEDSELIITRTVTSDGKSKATANGIAVSASSLSAISELLIEVHAQAANINIGKSAKQRDLLDKYAGSDFVLAHSLYATTLDAYHGLKSRIAVLKKSIDKKDLELSELRQFVSEFNKLKLRRNEFLEISGAIARLSNVEELRIAGVTAINAVEEEEFGALSRLATARRSLESTRSKDPELEAIYTQLSESFYLLNDAHGSLSAYLHSLEADPALLDFLNSRKADINALIKKYGGTEPPNEECELLIDRFEAAHFAIADLEGGDSRLKEMESQLLINKKELVAAAKKLTSLRCDAGLSLGTAVTTQVQQLAMPHATFSIQIHSADYNALKESDFTTNGCDDVSMFISAHRDAPAISISRGVSGGEMSRVMLALEVVIAATHPVGTYVFDEVDAGVGGKAAIEVGRRLHALSQHAQVIVVTHLPQVAAWADSHFVVTKDINGAVSQSNVAKVEGQARIEEIARMLAGLENSASAREHATELLSMRG